MAGKHCPHSMCPSGSQEYPSHDAKQARDLINKAVVKPPNPNQNYEH
ncbi:hypothetical protein ASB1_00060 [Helicobacter heilmannii]|uniref:Uncharacterized protein n=1 Tax=Helicobacter heilmannii TaxID=35817 RepID=A0A0K2Y6E8_HELHE|nr:hypothetical protein ASB1_00060 [Helicobacter heilmannii]GMB95305.1 hypothetical protein NHP21011_14070 [Helicobacter heilmannii]CRI34741.1 hypothetical protein HHE01_05420 [Helicobacter heilmannii]